MTYDDFLHTASIEIFGRLIAGTAGPVDMNGDTIIRVDPSSRYIDAAKCAKLSVVLAQTLAAAVFSPTSE